jgi:hypothetical protein
VAGVVLVGLADVDELDLARLLHPGHLLRREGLLGAHTPQLMPV